MYAGVRSSSKDCLGPITVVSLLSYHRTWSLTSFTWQLRRSAPSAPSAPPWFEGHPYLFYRMLNPYQADWSYSNPAHHTGCWLGFSARTAELHPGCWLERIMLDSIIVRGWLTVPCGSCKVQKQNGRFPSRMIYLI